MIHTTVYTVIFCCFGCLLFCLGFLNLFVCFSNSGVWGAGVAAVPKAPGTAAKSYEKREDYYSREDCYYWEI